MSSLRNVFDSHDGKPISKWGQYFPVYEFFFGHLVDRPLTFLEIGVWKGGSLQMWRQYLGPSALIVGIDIEEDCAKHTSPEEGIYVEIGSQADTNFLDNLLNNYHNFDVVVDDGSHVVEHQIATFSHLFPKMNRGGIYIVEDIINPSDEKKNEQKSFVDFCHSLTNDLYSELNKTNANFSINSIHHFPGITVIVKGAPFCQTSSRGGRFKNARIAGARIIDKINSYKS